MKIGLKLSDVRKGGKFERVYYNNVLVPGNKIERRGDMVYPDIPDEDVSFAWLVANIDDIDIKIAVYVEVPISFLDVDVPSWLPENTWTDEDDVVTTHTFKSWGNSSGQATEDYIARKSLDGTKMVIDLTRIGNGFIDSSMLTSIAAVSSATPMTVGETRALVKEAAYSVLEI